MYMYMCKSISMYTYVYIYIHIYIYSWYWYLSWIILVDDPLISIYQPFFVKRIHNDHVWNKDMISIHITITFIDINMYHFYNSLQLLSTPEEKYEFCQLGWWHSQLHGKTCSYMFQTTNQMIYIYIYIYINPNTSSFPIVFPWFSYGFHGNPYGNITTNATKLGALPAGGAGWGAGDTAAWTQQSTARIKDGSQVMMYVYIYIYMYILTIWIHMYIYIYIYTYR